MAYNYAAPPGAYQPQQTTYQAPGRGPPPSFDSAPGMQAHSPTQQNHFQPPPNMPNINFNAPVIRLGVDQQNDRRGPPNREGRGSNAEPLGNRNRLGLGAEREHRDRGGDNRNIERDRQAVRESMMALQPPTREEVARTIFVGGLAEGAPDDAAMENLLRCAGKLRRWTRARDAEDRVCKFGFAEYEDVESLEAANEILTSGVEVPVFEKNGAGVARDEEGEVKKMALLVVVDEQSKKYIDDWKSRRREDDDARQFRIDGCREDMRQCITSLSNAAAFSVNNTNGELVNGNGDTHMPDANTTANAEVVTIPLTLEDELSDIPAEMRATVAEEIKAFRDRSNRRDLERMRKEEDMEMLDRQRTVAPGPRINRLASPPPSGAPSGPASASNGIPVGPRGAAPTGPKGYRGAQMPSDYANGVAFVGANGVPINLHEDSDAEESDDELERRRQAKRLAEKEKSYVDAERRWLNRERTRAAAQEREKVREAAEKRELGREKELIANRLREWNDDEEAKLGREEYFYDRSAWLRKRGAYRDRESRDDDRDRGMEGKERGLADDFLDRMDVDVSTNAPTNGNAEDRSGFKMTLGSSFTKSNAIPTAPAATATTTTAAAEEMENLLEDAEEPSTTDGTNTKTLELKHLPAAEMSEDEARRALMSSIPASTSLDALFAYPVKWQFLTAKLLDEQIRPFVEKKIVGALGVQEDLVVDVVMEALVNRRGGEAVVEEVKEVLEEEAEGVVGKVWRWVVFWTEWGARG